MKCADEASGGDAFALDGGRRVLVAKPPFSLKTVARVTFLVSRCISIAPAMLDRYLAA